MSHRKFQLAAATLLALSPGCKARISEDSAAQASDQKAADIKDLEDARDWAERQGGSTYQDLTDLLESMTQVGSDQMPCDPADTDCSQSSTSPSRPEAQLALEGPKKDELPALPSKPSATTEKSWESDITALLDDNFVSSLKEYPCDGSKPLWTPFFPGLQKFGDNIGRPVLTRLGGDTAVANLYTKYAAQALGGGAIQDWMLLNYHNSAGLPGNPSALTNGGTMMNLFRVGSATRTDATRYPDQSVAEWGDREQMRMLGLWLAASEENFRAHTPDVTRSRYPDRDSKDFDLYVRNVVLTQEWVDFTYRAAWFTGLALKCHRPLFAHSGGGVPMLFLLRLIGLSPKLDVRAWLADYPLPIYGLEAVMSKETVAVVKAIPAYSSLVVSNYVVDMRRGAHRGSNVMRGLIAEELGFLGQSVFITGGVTGERLFNFLGGHANIGFYVLRFGDLPHISFLNAD